MQVSAMFIRCNIFQTKVRPKILNTQLLELFLATEREF